MDITGCIYFIIVINNNRFNTFHLIDHGQPGYNSHDHNRCCHSIGYFSILADNRNTFYSPDRKPGFRVDRMRIFLTID